MRLDHLSYGQNKSPETPSAVVVLDILLIICSVDEENKKKTTSEAEDDLCLSIDGKVKPAALVAKSRENRSVC